MSEWVNVGEKLYVLTIQWPDRGGVWERQHGIYSSEEKAKQAVKDLKDAGREFHHHQIDEWVLE